MPVLVGVLIAVMGLALLIAGGTGSAASLFQAFTGKTSSSSNHQPTTAQTSGAVMSALTIGGAAYGAATGGLSPSSSGGAV